MSEPTVHAIGEEPRVAGFALAGAAVHVAADGPSAIEAWDSLPASATLVLVTPRVAPALRARLGERTGRLVCVLPGRP
jgi:vacuolar-type H+-ATPase subunit F/Vma7